VHHHALDTRDVRLLLALPGIFINFFLIGVVLLQRIYQSHLATVQYVLGAHVDVAKHVPSRQIRRCRSLAADCIRIDTPNSTDLLRHPTSSRYRYTPVSLGMPYTKPNPNYLIVVFPPRHLPPTHHRHCPIAVNCVIVTLLSSTVRFSSRRVLCPPPQPSSTPSLSFPSCLYCQSAPLACGCHGSSTRDHDADVHAPSGIDER
jgi:hypothetical protein